MIRAFIGLSGALLLFTVAPALAQQDPTKAQPKAPPAQTAPARPLISRVPVKSPEQCRTACAQTYYFCLAENEQTDCAPAWSQCRLACNAAASKAR